MTTAERAAAAFIKQAAQQVPIEEEESHTGRNLAMVGVATAPMLGAIGQKPVLHDPHMNPNVNRFKNLRELERQARPGDVLLTSKPKGSFWKSWIKPLSGSEFYHAQPVTGRRKGLGTTMTAGQYNEPDWHEGTRAQGIKDMASHAGTIGTEMRGNAYDDVLLLRPKAGLTPEQKKKFVEDAMLRSREKYDTPKGVTAWLKDIFVPKMKGLENVPNAPLCEGGVCSTVSAMAHNAAGVPLQVGKAAKDIMPGDYLRSEAFKPVGVHMKNDYTHSSQLRRAMPYLARGALGLAGAGAIYAGTKDPASLAVVPGVAAGGALGAWLGQKLFGHKELAPGLMNAWIQYGDKGPKGKARLIKQLFQGRVPGMALGGLASYLAAQKLRDKLRGQAPDEVPLR